MTFVGKILTVLVLVMSLVFATMAVMVYATHVNYRDEVMRAANNVQRKPPGLKVRLDQLTKERDDLALQLNRLKEEIVKEKALREKQVAALEAQVMENDKTRAEQEQKIRDLDKLKTDAVTAMQITQNNLKEKEDQNQTLREEIRKARDDQQEAFARVTTMTDEVVDLQAAKERLEARYNELAADNNRARDLLRMSDVDVNADPTALTPKVDGEVRAVLPDGLVEVSIGSDDAIKARNLLEVYRVSGGQSRYLGRVEVVRTAADVAVCKVLPDYRKGPIQVQDRVTTKLN